MFGIGCLFFHSMLDVQSVHCFDWASQSIGFLSGQCSGVQRSVGGGRLDETLRVDFRGHSITQAERSIRTAGHVRELVVVNVFTASDLFALTSRTFGYIIFKRV